ncbi:MAG: LuxR C-terminal-related transcriptional regulator [Acidimicrobiales bacterium]
MQLEWPLVGRSRELERVAQALARDDVSGVVLYGPGGVGKTRLAAECLELGDKAGFATARAVATRASQDITLGALAPLLPDVGDRTFNLLGAAREALAVRAGDRPLLLFVDDGHLLDEVSASLLLQIAADRQVFVLVTVRSGEEVSDAITALWKDGHAERIDVPPLSDAQTDELVHEVLAGAVDPLAAAELTRISSGNPLALRELLLATDEAGVLRRDHGMWRLAGPVLVSARLVDLVEERLGTLSAPEYEVLEYVALGEPLGLGLLEGLAAPSAIESLERRGLIEVREDERRLEVWLGHPLHGEIVRAGLGAVRTRTVLRSLADAVETAGMRRRGDLLRVATWRLESGGRAETDLLVAAARQAFLVLDVDLARRLAGAAWELEPTVAAGHLLGHVLCDLGRFDEAADVLATTTELVADDADRVLVAMSRTENLYRMGRIDEAIAVNLAEEGLVVDDDWRLELACHRATHELLAGRPTEALAIVGPALAGTAVRPLVEGAIAGGTAMTFDGRPETAIALHERAYAAHLEIWEHELFQSEPGIQAIGIIQGLINSGRLGEARALLDLAWQAASESRTLAALGWFALQYGNLTVVTGDMEDALGWYRTAVEHFQASKQVSRQRWAHAGAALAAASLGRPDVADEQLAAIEASGSEPGFLEALVLDARAWALAARGDLAEAHALLDRAADEALDGQRTCASVALHSLARLGRPAAALERILSVAADAEGRLIPARATHVAALAADDGGELLAVATTFEDLGALLYAAEAAADAARALRRADRSRDASAAAQRSRHLASRCPGVSTPALALVETASPLTRREREVALLAAQGMASKAIADKLFLSVRTVDNHLQRAYEKLGVSGREELATIVEQLT